MPAWPPTTGTSTSLTFEALRLRDEGVGADHVEGGDVEDLLGVVDASLLYTSDAMGR